jgi:hypothetical protein
MRSIEQHRFEKTRYVLRKEKLLGRYTKVGLDLDIRHKSDEADITSDREIVADAKHKVLPEGEELAWLVEAAIATMNTASYMAGPRGNS